MDILYRNNIICVQAIAILIFISNIIKFLFVKKILTDKKMKYNCIIIANSNLKYILFHTKGNLPDKRITIYHKNNIEYLLILRTK